MLPDTWRAPNGNTFEQEAAAFKEWWDRAWFNHWQNCIGAYIPADECEKVDTLEWSYVVSVPLPDYYDGELWERIFPPQPD